MNTSKGIKRFTIQFGSFLEIAQQIVTQFLGNSQTRTYRETVVDVFLAALRHTSSSEGHLDVE